MITPSIRQDLQLLPGTPMEDGSPSWLIYDNLRNKYFTLGLNAFRILRHWIAGVDSKPVSYTHLTLPTNREV